MKETTEILDYIIHWRSKSENSFIGEIFHILRNENGGTWRVPIGFVFGFIQPGDEYSPNHWSIIMTIRDEVRYNLKTGTTTVFTKSTYKSKLRYKFDKSLEFLSNIERINPQLPESLKNEFIKLGFCKSPVSIRTITGIEKFALTDLVFDDD